MKIRFIQLITREYVERFRLNTAKLMDENQTLYKLMEMEYLERICNQVGNINVAGGEGLLVQLGKVIGA